MIADTTFFIDLLKNKQEAVKKAEEIERNSIELTTTSITVFELWRGFGQLDTNKKEKASQLIEQLTIYPLQLTTAKKAGQIANELDRKGQEIDPEDIMIAAIAIENNEEILTRNEKHFNRIQNLKIQTY